MRRFGVNLRKIKTVSAVFSAGLLLSSCAEIIEINQKFQPASVPTPTTLLLTSVTFEELPLWKLDPVTEALSAFKKSCKKIIKKSPTENFGSNPEMGKISDWITVCNFALRMQSHNETEARYFFETRFRPYQAIAKSVKEKPEGLFTGYYEPELRGSWQRGDRYRYPIFSRPLDIVSSDLGSFDPKYKGKILAGRMVKDQYIPYYSRSEIERGALEGRQLELLWVDNEVDAFFLHVQGSGRVRLPDNSHVRIGYSGRNGRPYRSLGREMIHAGIMTKDQVSMQSIRAWLNAYPLAGRDLMRKNESFIFFRVVEGEGPIGAQGVALTPGHSIAVDRKYIPLGVPIWVETTQPGPSDDDLATLAIAQDTGSAIKGPVRADLFWGFGHDAGQKAGIMNETGQYYLLLPRDITRDING